ncbi:hypothetical protein AB0454_22970 [Streptomyces sp. NPDC093509]|uniref:hypothetical protein n=1 Tax=Streptomyces sp. NPDC093509 TaxID=3154982 RepID=UPI00344E0261
MDAATQAWLLSKVGADTDLNDLNGRYTRLRSARAVAIEVLDGRLAALREQAATINVSSVVSVSYTENIKAYERELLLLRSGVPTAPDEPDDPADGETRIGVAYLVERPRR